MSKHYFKPLVRDSFFHILNRGNNKSKIFFNRNNYEYFLRRYDDYMSDYLTTYAFCLLGNHFHLLVKLKIAVDIISMAEKRKDLDKKLTNLLESDNCKKEVAELIVSNQFRKFFMSYAKSINNQEKRSGSLFQKNFERILIDNISYLNNVLHYIHYNPAHHGIIENFKEYPWSSYHKILKSKPSRLPKNEILESFSVRENYIKFHGESHKFEIIRNYIIE